MFQMYDHYQRVISKSIQKYMVIFGKDITLAKIQKVNGIAITPDGTVTQILSDPQKIIQEIFDEFSELSEFVARKIMGPMIEKTQEELRRDAYQGSKAEPFPLARTVMQTHYQDRSV